MPPEQPRTPKTAEAKAGPPSQSAEHGDRPSRNRRIVLLSLKVALSCGLLWFLFATFDIDDAVRRIGHARHGPFALAVLIGLVSVLIAAWRWTIILRAMNLAVPFRSALPIFWIGTFFNQALPSNLGGDALRMWRIFKQGADPMKAFGSVMMDRVMALIGLTVLVMFGLPFVSSLTDDPSLIRILVAVVVATLCGLGFLVLVDRYLPLSRKLLPPAAADRLVQLSRDVRVFLLSRPHSLPALALSVANHLILVAMVFVIARGLLIDIGFGECLVLMPPVLLFAMLPISYAGWGVREGAMLAAFGFVGVPPADTLALSIAMGLILIFTALPGGVIWFLSGNASRRTTGPTARG